ncbi:phytoene/squalene synthase family protein [Halorhabdus rudnickae]|uniref:phytoene/squalene synthase family protein n=1 Tax=Halorhabdus rudnickae TaxID=1775544 RepID=UPI001084285E|nr:phytoene/squalene synthase family protein [Halorhabdus rudnickae]
MSQEPITTSKSIHRRAGTTFYVATRVLPERVREATYVLYAFFRIADEVVDRPDPPPVDRQRAKLEAIRSAAKGENFDETVLSAEDRAVLEGFRSLSRTESFDPAEIDIFVDAMAQDIERTRYETHEELVEYMRGSAAAVGNMMLTVMDPDERERAEPHATSLAEAFQLTNFIRDVREDIRDYDRVYLPTETLDRFGITEDTLRRGETTEDVAAAIRTELQRTEALYRHGVAGIRYLPTDCQFAVLLSAVLYAEHHRRIRAVEYDVLEADTSLSMARRLWLVPKTYYHWRRTRDPEAAFYAASAITEGEAEPEHKRAFGVPAEQIA